MKICSLTAAGSVSNLTRNALRAVMRRLNRDDSVAEFEEFRVNMKNLQERVKKLEPYPCSCTGFMGSLNHALASSGEMLSRASVIA